MRSSASAGPPSRTGYRIRRTDAEDGRAHDAVAGRLLRGAGPRPELAPRRRGAARALQRAARHHERLRGGPRLLRAHGVGLADRRPGPGRPAGDARRRRRPAGGARGPSELGGWVWPPADQDPDAPPVMREFAGIWRAVPKIVFSRTLQEVGPNASLRPAGDPDETRGAQHRPGGA